MQEYKILSSVITVSKRPELRDIIGTCADVVYIADDPTEATDIIKTNSPDMVVVDAGYTHTDILDFLESHQLRSVDCSVVTPVVIITDGSCDYDYENFPGLNILIHGKDIENSHHFRQIISRVKNQPISSGTDNFFLDEFTASLSIAGRSKATQQSIEMIKLIAQSRCNPVLIVGHTGTGKELVARAIHHLKSPNEPFIAVNCAALTANLLESELFGHTKGSFTGADRNKTGLLELAGSGSLFLDEISEMPLELQAKLLRVVQEKTFRRVGGIENITCRAVIVASSNRNLTREVHAKRFRQDLYYRLNICPVTLAPLKSPQRRQDIRLLAQYFLATSDICPEKNSKITSFTSMALDALEKHDWPGNARELKNVIDRAVLLETTGKIGLNSIIIDPLEESAFSDRSSDEKIKTFSLVNAERKLISRALQETGWQKTRAAALLGITRATLYAKVKQYNIEKRFFAPNDPPQQSEPSYTEPAVTS